MSVLAWVVLGLVAGAAAAAARRLSRRGRAGAAGQLTAGALGAALGGLLASAVFGWPVEAPPPAALLAPALGALAALVVVRPGQADLPYE